MSTHPMRLKCALLPILILIVAGGCNSSGKTAVDAASDISVADASSTDIREPDVGGFIGTPLPQYECASNNDCYELYPESGPCDALFCDAAQGVCKFSTQPDFVICDDDNACTVETICVGGQCVGTENLKCDDDNVCTDDVCDPVLGCLTTPNSAPCDDGNSCTEGDACDGGFCTSGLSSCQCETAEDCVAFDDENPCNGTLICSESLVCVVDPTTIIQCAGPSVGCVWSTCKPEAGGCVTAKAPDGTACSDSDLCSVGDKCINGECKANTMAVCGEGNACVEGNCVAEVGCVFENLSGSCDDGNACTVDDFCINGSCIGSGNTCPCASNIECDDWEDGNECNGTLDCIDSFCEVKLNSLVICDPFQNTYCTASLCVQETGECVTSPINEGQPCDDGDLCTEGHLCGAGVCSIGSEVVCDDENVCTNDGCLSDAGCFHAPTTGPCDDDDPCTTGDACGQGECKGVIVPDCELECSNAGDCEDDEPCTVDSCTEEGLCLHTLKPECGGCSGDEACEDENLCTDDQCGADQVCTNTPNEDLCSDGDVCTVLDACADGACVPGLPVGCDDDDECTSDSCSPTAGCIHAAVPNCSSCNDPENSCDDGEPCTNDACNGSVCVYTPNQESCDDGDLCTAGDWCSNAVCAPGPALDCDDANPCTVELCDPLAGCVQTPNDGLECDPDNPCAETGVCLGGACLAQGGSPDCCVEDGDCDDEFTCTEGLCENGTCEHIATACPTGDPCSIGYCQDGTCLESGPTSPTTGTAFFIETFDDGTANGWSFETSNEEVWWSIKTGKSYSGTSSLYFGNPEALTYNFGVTKATASSPSIAIPDATVSLRFRLLLDVEEDHCWADLVYITVETEEEGLTVLSPFLCESSSNQFALHQIPLDGFEGKSVRIGFVFETYDDTKNNGTGAFLDDVSLLAFTAEECCALDTDCDDGDPCTNDSCDIDVGCQHILCTPAIPCNDPTCGSGPCSPVSGPCCGVDADCDDGFGCTVDTCSEGQCTHPPLTCPTTGCAVDFCFQGECITSGPAAPDNGQVVFFESFDDGTANGWTFTSDNSEVEWSLSTKEINSSPLSLYAGNAQASSYNYGTSEVTAKSPFISLPQNTLKLRFNYWGDVEEDHCFGDILFVVVASATPGAPTQVLQPKLCASTEDEWITAEYDLSNFAGASVQIWFGFATYDDLENTGEGFYVDDVSILAYPDPGCEP